MASNKVNESPQRSGRRFYLNIYIIYIYYILLYVLNWWQITGTNNYLCPMPYGSELKLPSSPWLSLVISYNCNHRCRDKTHIDFRDKYAIGKCTVISEMSNEKPTQILIKNRVYNVYIFLRHACRRWHFDKYNIVMLSHR